MGLDAFLMPQAPSSRRGPRPIGDFGEAIASPPINLEAQGEGPAPTEHSPPAAPRSESTSQGFPQAHVHGGPASPFNAQLTPELIAGIAIDPPEIQLTGRTPDAPGAERAPSGRQGRRYDHPAPTPPAASEKLGDFLTTVGNSFSPPQGDVGRIEEELMSTSPIAELSWASDLHGSERPTVREQRHEASPARSTGRPHPWEDGPSTPSLARRISDGTGAPDFGGEAERFEERLSQVAARLEQAVERLHSPAIAMGRSPRPFRGRIDG